MDTNTPTDHTTAPTTGRAGDDPTTVTTDALTAVRWDGTNTDEVEDLAGVRCLDETTVLVVPSGRGDDGLLGPDPLHVPLLGWLVRVGDELRVLPPDAAAALSTLTDRPAPTVSDAEVTNAEV